MSLAPGARLGPYEITGPLGAGGMGEVYRARDARLGRDVAVKALPASSAGDSDRIARFQREAQILAGLNHPHIAALYGIEESASAQFLIMELVEGGTLSARLKSGPLPVRDAIAIGRQIADALQGAHDRGIIHRDLKPANIAFTGDGHVKVLDFGLAKMQAAHGASDAAATVTAPAATQSGVVLGTAAYMSPEQARGLGVDKRTDIFAFGCVLYEMVTGRNPFAGETVSDIIAAILGREPDWTLLPPRTPARVQWLLRRCLEKDPRRRLHDIADARIELEEALSSSSDSGAIGAAVPTAPRSRFSAREIAAWVLALGSILALIVVMTSGDRAAQDGDADRVYSTWIAVPEIPRASPDPIARFVLSPDGRKIAFVGGAPGGTTILWVRALESPVAQPLAGTEGATHPFWSPDSRHIGFVWRVTTETTTVSGKLKRVDAGGGQAVTLADVLFSSLGSWGRNGVILFTPAGNSALHQVSASGGAPTPATTLDDAAGHVQHAHPSFLPNGRDFLYTAVGSKTGGATTPTGVYLGSIDRSRAGRLLIEGASQATYASGHLLFLRGSNLMVQPFDHERLELKGSPVQIAERIQSGSAGSGVSGAYSVSTTGLLAYQTTSPVKSQLAWFDRAGKQIGVLGEPADWVDVALSPDGARAASSMEDPAAGTRDVCIFDARRGLPERFTASTADDFAPVWSPRGDRLVFTSSREGGIDLYQKGISGGVEQRIPDEGLALGKFAADWSPDERLILFIAGGRSIARSDLMLLPVTGGKPEVFLDTPAAETQARFSPDGRWIAYVTNAPGRLEVYVKPYGRPGEPRRISAAGGRWPQWRRDGKELTFLSPDETMMAASIRILPDDVLVDAISPLFKVKLRPQVRLDSFPYDMTPDGARFLVNTFVEQPASTTPLTLIINWPASLK